VTSEAAANHIMVFDSGADGALKKASEVPTDGLGSGGGLGNQGALVLSDSENWLLAVNAGSNELSVFHVGRRGLRLVDKQLSGVIQPVSVTIHGDPVYVLNEGGAGNISGFRLSKHGKLSPIPGSPQPLNGVGTDPAQIGFHPSGRVLVVTVKDTNEVLTYTVNQHGRASVPPSNESSGATPFGYAFDPAD
jgi:6-phosphogluconolactonase (cycloisomerase 2 family)